MGRGVPIEEDEIMIQTRRAVLAALALLPPVVLASAASAETKAVKLEKLYPYLDMYLGLPPAQRSRFVMAYYLKQNGGRPTGLALTLIDTGGGRTAVPIGNDGRLLFTPALGQLKSDAQIEMAAPKGAKISLSMELQAVTRPRQSMETADLAAAIQQCEAAIRSKAGVLGFAAPKVKRIVFRGAGSGQAVNAAGVSRPLPMQTGHPAYDPEQMPGVISLQFARPPLALMLAGRA
jgi:hypothetical protein